MEGLVLAMVISLIVAPLLLVSMTPANVPRKPTPSHTGCQGADTAYWDDQDWLSPTLRWGANGLVAVVWSAMAAPEQPRVPRPQEPRTSGVPP